MTANTARRPLLLGWTSARRACGRHWSICTAERWRFGVAPIETDLSQADLGRARPARVVVGRRDGGAARAGAGKTSSPSRSPHRPRLHGLHGRGLRRSRQPLALPCSGWISALFREADEISATGDPVLRYVSGRVSPEWMLPKALAQAQRARDLRPGRPHRRMHRLDDVSTDRRVDAVAEPCRGQMELRAARRRLAGRALEGGRSGDLLEKWPARIVPLGKGGAVERPAAERTGLPAGIPVAQGGIDAYLGMLGMGATRTATSR